MRRFRGFWVAFGLVLPAILAGQAAQAFPATGFDSLPPLPSSEAGERALSLDEALALLEGGTDELRAIRAGLDAARAQDALTRGKAGPTLTGSAAWSISDGFSDPVLAKTAGASGLGLGQSLQGGLSYGVGGASGSTSSGTKLGLSLSHAMPATPQPVNKVVPQASSAQLSLSQSLWDGYAGGQARALVDKSALTLAGKELVAGQAGSAARAKVKQAYVTTLAAQRNLALRLATLEKQDALQRQFEATFALSQASAVDLAQARLNARTAELEAETARHDFQLARQRLANLIGLPPDADYRVAEIETPPLPAASLEEAVAAGLAARSDLAQLELTRRAAAIDAALARGAAQPTLYLTGGLGAALSWDGGPAHGESASLGIRLAAPILDSGAAKAQERAALGAAEAAAAQTAQLARNAAADIRDAWWIVSIQARKIELARQAWELSQTQLALVREQLRFGAATNQDLLTASVSAANAAAAWLKARSDHLLAVLALETAMGK